ncbi:MAG TPA: DUF1501 domain-containing protein [Lacipirellulaceae bacterium]|nr:DUF1501 domain-containing protein [Lacipirellulaceae bacterium]
MLILPGAAGRDLCDAHLGVTRRQLLRVGGSAMLSLTLADLLGRKQAGAADPATAPTGAPPAARPPARGFGAATSVIMVYLQGGPSQIDLWDPKEDVPDNVRSIFKPIATRIPGVQFTELLPKLAEVVDRTTLIRSLSYEPAGLFNHTAAIYQMLTGYTTDKVSPSGQLEPPNAKDFPNFGSQVVRLKPSTEPMLPFVMLPRPLQESNVIGKGGTAGFLGKAFDPYTLYPKGDDLALDKMDRISVADLEMRGEIPASRLARRASLRETLSRGMAGLERAVEDYKLDENYQRAIELIVSGRAREAFDLRKEQDPLREAYGKNAFGQSCLMARRLIEAGARVVEVVWPNVANGQNHSFDTHADLSSRLRDLAAPMFDAGLSALIADLDSRGMLDSTLVVAVGEFGRSPQRGLSTSGNGNSDDGRDHWPYCFTGMMCGGGIQRGLVYGRSDKTGSAPAEDPVHPTQLLATIYHALGIDPATMVMNHLNQPRELVKGEAVTGLFAGRALKATAAGGLRRRCLRPPRRNRTRCGRAKSAVDSLAGARALQPQKNLRHRYSAN